MLCVWGGTWRELEGEKKWVRFTYFVRYIHEIFSIFFFFFTKQTRNLSEVLTEEKTHIRKWYANLVEAKALGDTANWKLSGGEGINVSSVVFSDHPHEFKDSEKGYGIALASVALKHSVDSQGSPVPTTCVVWGTSSLVGVNLRTGEWNVRLHTGFFQEGTSCIPALSPQGTN